MSLYVVTGASGLVGSETVKYYCQRGADVIGIDNDQRAKFFGPAASTSGMTSALQAQFSNYTHLDADIRDAAALEGLLSRHNTAISGIIHTAAQPSHDWAASAPMVDFQINASATLQLLDLARRHCPIAPFVFTSTNKVYGDRVNDQKYDELPTRWEIHQDHAWYDQGVPESASIDATKHSVFGVSKVAADLMVQEYGRYFGLPTACFRCGCITGSDHSGAKLHGFLSYLVKCAREDLSYSIIGHKGKQVRDNIHGADLVAAFADFIAAPRSGEVYNMGGGRQVNVSMQEAIAECESRTGRKMRVQVQDNMRSGDHIWWVSDLTKFRAHYPDWALSFDLAGIFDDLFASP